jgi:hypothetical protein
MSLESTWPRFDWGVTGPCLVQWTGTYPGWLSPMNGDPGSTQILTRHCSTKSQTISQLRSYTYYQVSTVQPLRVIKTPKDGVSRRTTF